MSIDIGAEEKQTINVTASAVKKLRETIDERNLEDHALRVFIAGSGCSGLQYGMALDNEPREDDIEFTFNLVKVVIDPMSLQYMAGSTIDFIETPNGGGFQIDNPNPVAAPPTGESSACASCSGCG